MLILVGRKNDKIIIGSTRKRSTGDIVKGDRSVQKSMKMFPRSVDSDETLILVLFFLLSHSLTLSVV